MLKVTKKKKSLDKLKFLQKFAVDRCSDFDDDWVFAEGFDDWGRRAEAQDFLKVINALVHNKYKEVHKIIRNRERRICEASTKPWNEALGIVVF